VQQALGADMCRRKLQGIILDCQVNQRHHFTEAQRQLVDAVRRTIKTDQSQLRNLFGQFNEEILADIQGPHRGHVPNLHGQMSDLIAANIQLDEPVQTADLFGQRN